MFLYVFHVFFYFQIKTCFECLFLILKSMFSLHQFFSMACNTVNNNDKKGQRMRRWFCAVCPACASHCKSCATNGDGKCDAGQCITGYYFDAGKTSTCLRKLSLFANSSIDARVPFGIRQIRRRQNWINQCCYRAHESSHRWPSTWVGWWAPSVSRMN